MSQIILDCKLKKLNGKCVLHAIKGKNAQQWIYIDSSNRNLKNHEPLLSSVNVSDLMKRKFKEKVISVTVDRKVARLYLGHLLEENGEHENDEHENEEDENKEDGDEEDGEEEAEEIKGNENEIISNCNERPTPNDVQNLSELFIRNQNSLERLMVNMTHTLSEVVSRIGGEPKKMDIKQFNCDRDDPATWLLIYERACECNKWFSDRLKINNLISYLAPQTLAEKWYYSLIGNGVASDWEAWKSSFLNAFSHNRLQMACKCNYFTYKGGSYLNYYYEKERLINSSYGPLPDRAFILMMLAGLPEEVQTQVMSFSLSNRQDMVEVLGKLKPRKYTVSASGGGYADKIHKQDGFYYKNQSKNCKDGADDCDVNKMKPVFSYSCLDYVPLPTEILKTNNLDLKTLLDTGSNVNLINSKIPNEYSWKLIKEQVSLKGFNGFIKQITFKVLIEIEINNLNFKSFAYVVDNLSYDLVLGIATLKELGYNLVNNTNNKNLEIKSKLGTEVNVNNCLYDKNEFISKFPTSLDDVSYSLYSVNFKLKENPKIIRLKPYRLSRDRYEWAQTRVQELLDRNIIQISNSEYASPCVIVPKENGTLRLCQDYRAINNETELDPYPFPIIDDLICNFGGCNFFSKIDLKDGFYQVPLTKETRKYTAFVVPFGHYEFNFLPFGWKNSPPIFQRFITKVLGKLLNDTLISAYLDDILIGGRSREECAIKTFKVVERLTQENIKINWEKSQFCVQSVIFLGRVIDGQTKTTKQESIDKVRNMNRPHDLHTLRVFTGLTSHFRAFIKDYATIVRPLDKLKGKEVQFCWEEEQEKAFRTLVTLITSNPVLQLPDWALPFEMCTDASNTGCGAILYQRDHSRPKKQQLRVIGYFSHTFTKAEANYSVTDKEGLAVIKAINYFRSYIEARELTIHTDHQALTHIMNLKEPRGRLGRWQVFLMSFNLKINHRSGKELEDADAISRLCTVTEMVNTKEKKIKNNRRLEVNREMVPAILRWYHDDPSSGGHDGFFRTYRKIRNRFTWPKMKNDIKQYVKSCHDCQLLKFKYRPKPDVMVLQEASAIPFECLHLDFGERQKKSEMIRQTQSFIVAVDECSRFVYAKAMKENSRGVVNFLKELPCIESVKKIVTDNGPQFTSEEMKNFARERNIQLSTTAPFHPAANGLAERKIRDIKQFLSIYKNFRGGWKNCLEAAVKHINRSYCISIGCSPQFRAFGIKATFPADSYFNVPIDILEEKVLPHEKQQLLRERNKKYFDKRTAKSFPEITEADQVLVQCGWKGKVANVKGPYQVQKIIRHEGFPKTVKYLDENGNLKVAAIQNVLLYHGRSHDSSQSGGM